MLNEMSVEYLKSGLSINTHIGCNLGCSYCVLSTGISQFPPRPVLIKKPGELIDTFLSGEIFFTDGMTPIFVNNRTDPFLPDVIESSYDVLRLLSKIGIRSPIVIISKLAPDERFASLIKDLNVLYMYTYSGLIGMDYNSEERVNNSTLKMIEHNVPYENRYHYYRPIIPGYNDSEESILSVIEKVKRIFRLTVAGGIRVNKDNSIRFSISDYDVSHKKLSEELWRKLTIMTKKELYSVVRHTSCAVAVHMREKNKLQYYESDKHCSGSICPNYDECIKGMFTDHSVIEKTIMKYTDVRFEWVASDQIVFHGCVRQELLAYLRSSYGLKAIADHVILSPSEQIIIGLKGVYEESWDCM